MSPTSSNRIRQIFGGVTTALSIMVSATIQAQSDNFNDGDDVGWTHFTPAASTFSFPASSQGGLGYKLETVNLAPAGRVASILNGPSIPDFTVSVDLVDWSNPLRQEMGVMARVQPSPWAGLLPSGYSFIYVNRFSSGSGGTDQLRIYKDGAAIHTLLTGSGGQFAQGTLVNPLPNPASGDYRLVFSGYGSLLSGQIIDLNTMQPMSFSTGGASETNTLWAVDTTYTTGLAGVIAVAGQTVGTVVDPTFDNFSVVPEPSMLTLTGVGLVALAVRNVRRSKYIH